MFIIASNENIDARIVGCGLATDGITLSTITSTTVRAKTSTIASLMNLRVLFMTFGYCILSIGFSIVLNIFTVCLHHTYLAPTLSTSQSHE